MSTRDRVAELLRQGLSQNAVARTLGISKSTVSYHARNLGRPRDERVLRRYDWAEVQSYYDAGHSISACQKRFGFARATWNAARRRGDVRSRPPAMSIDELLAGPRNRSHVRMRLVAAGLKEDRCECCGLDEWLGRPLALQLHHVNGDGRDNRLENLEVLCPNRHSLTDTWGGRNRGRVAASGEAGFRHTQVLGTASVTQPTPTNGVKQ